MTVAQFDFGTSVQQAVDTFFAWLPNLAAALIILILGFFVAKLVAVVVGKATRAAGLDRRYHESETMRHLHRFLRSPAYALRRVTFWLIFLIALSWSLSALGSPAVDAFVAAVWAYVPHILAALVIFIVAAAVAAGVAALARRTMGGTALGRIVEIGAPVLVMTIATFMILTELQLAAPIVMITYAALVGALALGAALAFGLGGREVAGDLLRGAYDRGRERQDEFKRDLDQATTRAREQADEARERHEHETHADATTSRHDSVRP